MKANQTKPSHTPMFNVLLPLLLLPVSLTLWAQPLPHHFSGITPLPDKTVALSLDGSVSNMFNLSGTISNQFMQLFDLYVVEASTNLADWTRLALLLRTNNNPNPLLFQDTNAPGFSQRFYRTFTNHLITLFPKPSGPFAVGTVDRIMIDPTRTNRYRYSPATNAFMVTFWYPAEPPGAGVLPGAMWDQRIAADTGVYALGGNDTRWAWIVPKAVGHHFVGAPVAVSPGRYPVVLHAHGLPGWRKLHSQKAEELASHGYVVVATDHPDCWATEFPDGRYLSGNHSGDVTGRLKDMQFLLDELARLDSGDPLFAGRLDLDHIGVYGSSYGGMVVETCRSESRVKCAALWDATNVQLNNAGLQKPFLAALGENNGFYSEDQWLFSKATTNAVLLQIRGADHQTCSDSAWGSETAWGRGPTLAISACFVWFFDTYLKGEAPPFPTNPEIYNVQRKMSGEIAIRVGSLTDIDGRPRVVSGTADIGAYEFQGPGSVISYAWLQQYGLSTDGSADATDPDADGLNTWQEWRWLTDPTNALSVLRLLSASPSGTNVTVSWQSVAGVSYFLERSTDLSATPRFSLLATNLIDQGGTMIYTDTNAAAAPRFFYRVGVP